MLTIKCNSLLMFGHSCLFCKQIGTNIISNWEDQNFFINCGHNYCWICVCSFCHHSLCSNHLNKISKSKKEEKETAQNRNARRVHNLPTFFFTVFWKFLLLTTTFFYSSLITVLIETNLICKYINKNCTYIIYFFIDYNLYHTPF